jgi:hypothetical protein
MSSLHRGDDGMHYCDNSHRWIAPVDVEQGTWEAKVRAHLDEHRATMNGGAVRIDELWWRQSLRVPEPKAPVVSAKKTTTHRTRVVTRTR